MTSLRSRLVEAGVRAFVAHMMALSEPDNLTLMDEDLKAGEAALDAMLDCLTENADEWADDYWGESDPDPYEEGVVREVAKQLIAVLGEDR